MATTRYKAEIRLFRRPAYFRSKFIGGRMEKRALVLKDALGETFHLCVSIRDMKKLPTMSWCQRVYNQDSNICRFALIDDTRLKDSVIVWAGEISETKYNMLVTKYRICP